MNMYSKTSRPNLVPTHTESLSYLAIIFALTCFAGCGTQPTTSQTTSRDETEIRSQLANAMERFETHEMQGRLVTTPQLITNFESEIGAPLPTDYRIFLENYAGLRIEAVCSIKEPTPCGQEALIERFFGFFDADNFENSLSENSDLSGGAPTLIPIASSAFGSKIFLFVSGPRKGKVYYYDGERRADWSDEEFTVFPSLAPSVKTFLELRQKGTLPPKPANMKHFYLVANSFTEYLESCEIQKD